MSNQTTKGKMMTDAYQATNKTIFAKQWQGPKIHGQTFMDFDDWVEANKPAGTICRYYGAQFLITSMPHDLIAYTNDWIVRMGERFFPVSDLAFKAFFKPLVQEDVPVAATMMPLAEPLSGPIFGIGSPKGWPGLSKLIEEDGELATILAEIELKRLLGRLSKVAGKVIQTPDGHHWDGELEPLLIEEMGDVWAAIIFLAKRRGIRDEVVKRMMMKCDKFDEWEATGDTKPVGDGK